MTEPFQRGTPARCAARAMACAAVGEVIAMKADIQVANENLCLFEQAYICSYPLRYWHTTGVHSDEDDAIAPVISFYYLMGNTGYSAAYIFPVQDHFLRH